MYMLVLHVSPVFVACGSEKNPPLPYYNIRLPPCSMAPRSSDWLHRLAAAGQRAVTAETLALPPENRDVRLTCRYLGLATASGAVSTDQAPTLRAHAHFEWTATAGDLYESSTVSVRCDHAVDERRTIPLPEGWRFAERRGSVVIGG